MSHPLPDLSSPALNAELELRQIGFQVDRRPNGTIRMIRPVWCTANDKMMPHLVEVLQRIGPIDEFSVCFSDVTGKGLDCLHELKQVQCIRVIGTKANKKAINRLERALPGCVIER